MKESVIITSMKILIPLELNRLYYSTRMLQKERKRICNTRMGAKFYKLKKYWLWKRTSGSDQQEHLEEERNN
jgi:hypothetical protein